jgi:hypothetical protein
MVAADRNSGEKFAQPGGAKNRAFGVKILRRYWGSRFGLLLPPFGLLVLPAGHLAAPAALFLAGLLVVGPCHGRPAPGAAHSQHLDHG